MAISLWTNHFSSDNWSQAMLNPVSALRGERLVTLGTVGIKTFFIQEDNLWQN